MRKLNDDAQAFFLRDNKSYHKIETETKMNGRTRRSSKGKGKTVSGKKRKSTVTVTTNDTSTSYSTDRSGTDVIATATNRKHTTEPATSPVPGRGSKGKKGEQICLQDNGNNDDSSTSTITSIVDTTDDSDSDDESIAVNQIKEKIKLVYRTLGEIETDLYGTAPVKSVVTQKPKRTSFSDLSNSQRSIAYFKENQKDIKRQFKVVILQETFAQMKFLMNKKETPSIAEMVVLKAINMKHVHIPKYMNTGEYVRGAEKYVHRVYSKLRSQVQQDLRQRWLSKL